MMTIMPASSWNIFLDSAGSMKTSRLLPHTPLWVSHSSAYLHKSIVTTMDDKLQALDFFVMLHLNLHIAIFHGFNEIFLLMQAHANTPNPMTRLYRIYFSELFCPCFGL